MSTDTLFHRWAMEFPDAIPALLGLDVQTHYRAESPVLKKEHRIDAVLVPEDPHARRLLIEFQAYRDDTVLHRLVAEAGMYCEREQFSGTLHLAVVFTERSFAEHLPVCSWELADRP